MLSKHSEPYGLCHAHKNHKFYFDDPARSYNEILVFPEPQDRPQGFNIKRRVLNISAVFF